MPTNSTDREADRHRITSFPCRDVQLESQCVDGTNVGLLQHSNLGQAVAYQQYAQVGLWYGISLVEFNVPLDTV